MQVMQLVVDEVHIDVGLWENGVGFTFHVSDEWEFFYEEVSWTL